MKNEIELRVNGKSYEVVVTPRKTLLQVLRDTLGLTGTKEGCGIGECGTCTVLVDGRAVNACLIPAIRLVGREVLTIEGLAEGEHLHPVQESFVRHGAVQCGFCTPGMVLSAKALLDVNPCPSREDIKQAISGNLCRCTGYKQIIDAIEDVGKG